MFGTRHAGMLFGFVFLAPTGSATSPACWLRGESRTTTGTFNAMWWISIVLGLAAAIVHLPIHKQRAQTWAPAPA